MRRPIVALLASVLCWGWAVSTLEQLDGVEVELTEVADSGAYNVYSYSITNPSSSTWALAVLQIDISATSGTPANLAVTGDLFDATVITPGIPHAEVGPITPGGWEASLSQSAALRWYAPSDGLSTSDSIAPGQSKGGFGIRSSYLPGIHVVEGHPTVESCCLDVAPGADGPFYPRRADFAVSGHAVVPRYHPEEITIEILQEQLDAVCDDPLWIDDAPLCAELADSLEVIADRLAINNYWGSEATLFSTRDTLWNEQVPGGAVEWNAQWLLRTNLLQLFENWPSYQQSNVRLCASAESETEGYFTVTTTGPEQLVPATVTIDAESGMDEPGSSCQMLWLMPLGGTDPVTVKIKLDSVSAGSELEEFGYGYSGTPIVGPDSIVTTHDGNTTAYVHFIFVDN